MTEIGSEGNKSTSFKITSYTDGYYESNGDRIELPFSQEQIKEWDHFNTILEGKGFGKGQKLILPSEAKSGYKLIFGRQTQLCDVIVDTDITGNYTERVGCFKETF